MASASNQHGPDLIYDGQTLTWNGHGTYRASSGMVGFQLPRQQCVPEKGPVPSGNYAIALTEDKKPGQDDGTGICNLKPSSKIQRIPRGKDAGDCEPYWSLWGFYRVRLEPADAETAQRCKPWRGGFYIHDSEKGFTHGCIEVEPGFFKELLAYLAAMRARRVPLRKKLSLAVRYVAERPTNGGTKKAP